MLRKSFVPVAFLAVLLISSAAYAQYGPGTPTPQPQAASPLTRTVLQTVDFPTDQYKSIEIAGTLAPHGFAPWHTHPGYEIGYLLSGEGDLMVKGQPTRHLKAGDSWATPPDTPHAVQNTSDAPFKFVSTYVVEKSKPLATPAQAPT